MEIIVEGHKIDTKDIFNIYEIEKHKKMFINRRAGFTIVLIGGEQKHFYEHIPYESFSHEIQEAKQRWEKLRKAVEEKWNQDKNDLPVFKI